MNHLNDPRGATSPIDNSKLDDLRMLSDDDGPDILSELIDIFLDDTPARLIELANAVKVGDSEGTMQNGHALKSSCAQLGALQLSEYCDQLEAMGRAGDISAAQPVVAAAQAEFERARAALLAVKAAG
jgi:HPt (histidine-containing phosphotransfer) domain-containing protein